jgi:hypothetical protein
MVAYSFQHRFVQPILDGTKRQTIRADRTRHARPGEALQLYTAMRTSQCRLIRRATCTSITRITLNFVANRVVCDSPLRMTILYRGALDEFARSDGFANWRELRGFWETTHPAMPVFGGWLIQWAA